MPKRSAMVWLPALVLLVLTWGTCPCLYANMLTGGAVGIERDGGGGCACACANAGHLKSSGDSVVADAQPFRSPGKCPCIDTIGTMHELPQPEESSDLSPPLACTTQELPELARPAERLGSRSERAAPGADPGPEHRSVVLLV